MKLLTIIGLICFPLLLRQNLCHAQNGFDSNGKKTGKWIFKGKDHPRSGHASNTKVEEGNFIQGRKEGMWIKYHRDGRTIRVKGHYANNRPSGFYIRYHKNAKKFEEANFIQDKYKGVYNRYYTNGKPAYSGNYNNKGEESGLIKYYFKNGKVQMEYMAKNGKPFGKIKNYYRNGSLKSEIILDGAGKKKSAINYDPSIEKPVQVIEKKTVGAPVVNNPNTHGVSFEFFGYNKVYNSNDEIWMDGIFKNGKLWDGKLYIYDEDGIIQKVKVFKKGVYHSDGQL
ncbi:MAG: hypothetical protein P8K10_06430 [Crocinitomicaceae bacterium]|nr:hypothetical protein [Crocinitomicaceae bacterium]